MKLMKGFHLWAACCKAWAVLTGLKKKTWTGLVKLGTVKYGLVKHGIFFCKTSRL